MNAAAELEAMAKISEALSALDDLEARSRVIRWAAEAHGASMKAPNAPLPDPDVTSRSSLEFESIGRLFEVAEPTSNPERVLVVAYWHQAVQGEDDLSGQIINNELKHMGYPIPNITSTMSSLMERSPALIRQIRKSGKSKQARKTYTMTEAGKAYVKSMLGKVQHNGD